MVEVLAAGIGPRKIVAG